MPSFPSKTLAQAWAIACGIPQRKAPQAVKGRKSCWSSVPGPALRPSCLFCKKLGRCGLEPSKECGFKPNKWWPKENKKSANKQLTLF